MIRTALLAVLFCLAAPAAAQTAVATPELTRASHAIGALWRPLQGPLNAESIRTACTGAAQELTALDAAMPSELTPASAARVRGLRGLHVIPIADQPGAAYFFPPLGMSWFTPGLGGFSVINEAEGFIGIRDAAGQELAFQIGTAGPHRILRIRKPDEDILNLVRCEIIAPL